MRRRLEGVARAARRLTGATAPASGLRSRMVGPTYPADSPPLSEQQVKSAFELPWGAELPAAQRLLLHGRSWSGAKPIRCVEVRVDGPAGAGRWERARLHGPNLPHAWMRWTLPWTPKPPGGDYELLARATDRDGTTQPDSVPFNTGGYQFWAVVRHPVTAV
jgi:hypothetical protein